MTDRADAARTIWSRLRLPLAVVLATVAGAMLWKQVGALRAELEGYGPELSSPPEPQNLPAGAVGRNASPRPAAVPDGAARVRLVEVAKGFEKPLFVGSAPGDSSGRLFVVEQTGRIRIVEGGAILEPPFLDLSREVDLSGNERGLLGLAFAPDYAESRRFYVSYTVRGAVRVVRHRATADPRLAEPSGRTILEMDDPASNHNGGGLAFGPDGMLWIGTGDGGSGGDPWDNARNPKSLLGKMLRIDVSGERYAIPPDNPFVDRNGYAEEIWALGLRNPWRYSFDRATGELWIGDVGQNAWEEIDAIDPKRGGGAHFGWRTMEGFHCYRPGSGCDPAGLTLPVHAYGREDGCSVTGGYVYRGRDLPGLAGNYLFADYCTGRIWTLSRSAAGAAEVARLVDSKASVSSFGEDAAGELYVCDHGGGRILRLAPAL